MSMGGRPEIARLQQSLRDVHGYGAILRGAFVLVVCLALLAFLATSWWRGRSKPKSQKQLAHTPGIRVVCIQDSAPGSSNGDWESPGREGRKDGEASKWEQSKQKGDLGYYFAHHITMKELAPEDYQMNGPRLLSKGDPSLAASPNGAATTGGSSAAAVTRRRRPQQISSYSWEDCGEEVRLTFRQSEWEWAKVEAEEIGVEWSPRRFRMSIDSREYGFHAIDLQRLNADVAGVRVRKLKSRLVVALVKSGRGRGGAYGRTSAWTKLQAEPKNCT